MATYKGKMISLQKPLKCKGLRAKVDNHSMGLCILRHGLNQAEPFTQAIGGQMREQVPNYRVPKLVLFLLLPT